MKHDGSSRGLWLGGAPRGGASFRRYPRALWPSQDQKRPMRPCSGFTVRAGHAFAPTKRRGGSSGHGGAQACERNSTTRNRPCVLAEREKG